METTIRRKILLAVDGSDQALDAVRYVCDIVLPECTEIVIFNVGSGFPDVFWDMDNNPLYRSKKPKVIGWLADHQLVLGEFKEKAYKVLADAGFSKDDVRVKTQTRKTGVLKDIIQESYQDYSAIVVGRTGMSRLKDLFVRSLAYKLAEKVKHIPTVIVGGKPQSRKILIALDESMEAMRGVSCIGALAGPSDPEITLCHCLDEVGMSRIISGSPNAAASADDQRTYCKNRFRPYMDEASQRLAEAGVSPDKITRRFVQAKGDTIQKIIHTASTGNFSTLVVGRREDISFNQEYFRGRFSDKVIKAMDNMAVWVVS